MHMILAKSAKAGCDPVTLQQHTQDVIAAAKELFGDAEPTRLGCRWMEFFRLGDAAWPVFRRDLVAACALHDWGKANDSFQNAVLRTGKQSIRHEHLSTLLIGLPAVADWLDEGGIDVPLVMSVVLAHHLKAGSKRSDLAAPLPESPPKFRLLIGNALQQIADDTARVLNLPKLDISGMPAIWVFGKRPNDVYEHRDRIDRVLSTFKSSLSSDFDCGRKRMLTAVRSALIAADAAGSGLVREGYSISDWIVASVTNSQPLTRQRIWSAVIEKRVGELKAKSAWLDKGDGKEGWSDFQIACDSLPNRALLLAPCGSGKTLAAWRWIAGQLEQRPARHVLFLYPTRATAREGFKDYVGWAAEEDAALMHGTSAFDLTDMFVNPSDDDERHGRTYEVERRLFSLAYWPRRVFSATVDQFLAFMQYGYGPMCMLPVLADSVVVIDEVHSFDRHMFSALKDFLCNFQVPVLCMTATLPNDRRDQLVNECGLAPSPAWPDDLMKVARQARYRVSRVADRDAAAMQVREALAHGKRVLWVVNQVRRAHEIVREFAANFDIDSSAADLTTVHGAPLVCYHSWFRLFDRNSRHSDTMRLLKKPAQGQGQAALGVTTQVCEMSLDIDVDLLVTEECPATSQVQRMGRCNRERNARPLDQSGMIVAYPPDSAAPYSNNDLSGIAEFLMQAENRDLSQAEIEEIMVSVPSPEREGDPDSRFLTSGPYAVGPREDEGEGFREGNDFNFPCVLPQDVDNFNRAQPDQRPGFVVPVPKNLAKRRDNEANPAHARLPAYLMVADPDHYHPAIGFLNNPINEWRVV